MRGPKLHKLCLQTGSHAMSPMIHWAPRIHCSTVDTQEPKRLMHGNDNSNLMKRLATIATLATGIALVSPMAEAENFPANDLYLGFTSASATSDYIIDIGQGSVLANAGSSVDLSGAISKSTFDSVFSSGATGVNMSVVGGSLTFQQDSVYLTQVRLGGAADATVAGSPDLSGLSHSPGSLASAAGSISAMSPHLPTAGNGFADAFKSYTTYIAPTLTVQSFYGATGVNPLGTIDNSGVLREDLWHADVNNAYNYVGYLTLDVSGSNPSLTFTPAKAVPEPGTLGLFIGAGIMFLAFGYQSKGNN